MRFVGYKDNVEICRQFEPKDRGINVQVIMLKVSFLRAKRIRCYLVYFKKNQLVDECSIIFLM